MTEKDACEIGKCMNDKTYFINTYLTDYDERISDIIFSIIFEQFKVVLILSNTNYIKQITEAYDELDFPCKPNYKRNNKREILLDNGVHILFGLERARGRGISYTYVDEDYKKMDEFRTHYYPILAHGKIIQLSAMPMNYKKSYILI
jgi:hypothetical protein